MAFTGSYVCTSFLTNIMTAAVNLSTDTLKIALYTNSATLTAATTAYTVTGEVASGGGYTTGGETVTATISTETTANGVVPILTFSNPTWVAATFTTRGALIYDDTHVSNLAIAVIDFGVDIVKSGTDFTITFPPATANAGFMVFPVSINS